MLTLTTSTADKPESTSKKIPMVRATTCKRIKLGSGAMPESGTR